MGTCARSRRSDLRRERRRSYTSSVERPKSSEGLELVLEAKLDPKDLGRLLRKVRECAHVSQSELAQRLGLPYQNLSRLENGAREGMLSTLNRYVRALGWELVLTARPRVSESSDEGEVLGAPTDEGDGK